MVATFFIIILFVVWLLAVCGLSVAAGIQCMDGSPHMGAICGVSAIVLFAAGAVVVTAGSSQSDPRLCLSGHQEWQQHTSHVIAGKIIIPQTSTRKVWFCDKWEAE